MEVDGGSYDEIHYAEKLSLNSTLTLLVNSQYAVTNSASTSNDEISLSTKNFLIYAKMLFLKYSLVPYVKKQLFLKGF